MAGRRGGPTTIGGARKVTTVGGVFSWRTKREGWVKREKSSRRLDCTGSTEKAAGVGWMDFQPRIDNNCLNQALVEAALPPLRTVAPGGRRWWEGEGLKTKRKTKEHPVRRIAPSMAYLHPLGGVARPPLFRDDSLNTARRTHPLFPFFSLSLSLSLSQRATRLLPIHPLGMPPFHPVTSGTALEINRAEPCSCASYAIVRSR